MYRQAGMTLLEVLVVLVITASLATLVVLRFNQTDSERLRKDAESFARLFEQYCQEALIRDRVHAVVMNDRGFDFHYWQSGQWLDEARRSVFRPRSWQGDWRPRLSLNAVPIPLGGANPEARLICQADGELPVFRLRLQAPGQAAKALELYSSNGLSIQVSEQP